MERGNVFKPRTVQLPAAGNDPYEVQECNQIEYVSIIISYGAPIQWVFARNKVEALDAFSKGFFFIYRGSDTQYEIPCRSNKGFFYVRRFGNGPALNNGLSIALIQGAER